MVYSARSSRWLRAARSAELPIVLFIFLAALAYFNLTLHLTLELRDEGYLFFNIARVSHGEIPHRDFIEIYGPGVYAVSAPVFRMFGDRVLPLRELLALIRAAAVVFSYLIARHFVPRPFALLGALVATAYWGWSIWTLNTPYAALFTIPLCMLSLVILLRGESRGSRVAYVGAGFVCGIALLFKWTLAAMSAYGMVLAICASAMLRQPPPGPRTHRLPVLCAWVVAGLAIVVPFRSTLTPFDYLLHIAPIHALLALVALRFARFGDGRSSFVRAIPLVARYGAGFLVPPLLVAALYLSWGALGDLLYNTVYRPLRIPNYYHPVSAPPRDSVLLLIAIAAWVTAGLVYLRHSRRASIGLFAFGAVLMLFGYPAIEARGGVTMALQRLMLQLPAITSFATMALLAATMARPQPPASERSVAALITALFFHEMMSFQIFPRGQYNVSLMLGTLAPIVAYLTYRWYRVATAGESPPTLLRRSVAFILVLLPLVLIMSENLRSTISAARERHPAQPVLHSPALAGIRPKREVLKSQDLAAFDRLITHLERAQPADAPLFVVNNEPMIYFLTGREPLFVDHAATLFLAGWNMLPENDRDAPSSSSLIERLKKTPEVIVVTRRKDKTTRNFMRSFPQVARYIARNFRVERRFGDYRVMRRMRAR